MGETELDKKWNEEARKHLLHRRIVEVRYATEEEAAEDIGVDHRPLLLMLDDGTSIIVMSDDEGNNAGTLHLFKGDKEIVLPRL